MELALVEANKPKNQEKRDSSFYKVLEQHQI